MVSPERSSVTSYRQMVEGASTRNRLRTAARSAAIFALSRLRDVPRGSSWLRFPYYHQVFNDERSGFARQLAYLRNFGDFISLDDAVEHLGAATPPRGRYFSITFDDGFENCLTNAVPILVEHHAKAAFFLPTHFIGQRASDFYGDGKRVDFLDWDGCRKMVAAGMTIGSHTVNHAKLIDLSSAEVERELRESKETIERELGAPCHHFCCPWGRPGLDFTASREPEIARRLGYRSFLTTERGSARKQTSAMLVARDHTLANWGTYQLRYFFSR